VPTEETTVHHLKLATMHSETSILKTTMTMLYASTTNLFQLHMKYIIFSQYYGIH